MRRYIQRAIEQELLVSASSFPVVIVTGARQTGKSTLLKHLFPNHKYVTLDYPNIRNLALNDPELFLDNYGENLIIDEIQYAPDLLQYIKIRVDENRDKTGVYLLTGSQYFPLMAGVSESLAGRVSVHNLLGMSIEELGLTRDSLDAGTTFNYIFSGFYPDPLLHGVRVSDFYGSYLQTYLERDIRSLMAVHDLSVFSTFMEILAARAGSVLNLNEVSRDCGVSFSTAKRWLSLLESTQIVYLLRPFFKNVSKRVVKSPKLYFYDTGLLAYILRYQSSETLLSGAAAGNIFENFVIIEFIKQKANHAVNAEFYYYRDSNGNEVDVVIEQEGGYSLVELKMAKTLKDRFAQGLRTAASVIAGSSLYLLSFDTKNIPMAGDVKAMFWQDFVPQIGKSPQ
jgi:predicted AAA+ superfamily ATPase